MATSQWLALALTAIIIPVVVAEVRYRTKLAARLQGHDAFIEFLKTYLLKNAVLEFHSPDPQHKASDKAIERLVEGKELTAEEIDALAHRIHAEAKFADDTKRRLQAQTTLVLMDEFLEAVTGRTYTAFSDFE